MDAAALKAMIAAGVSYLTSLVGGGWAWLAKLVFKYGGQVLYDYITLSVKKIKRKKIQDEALKENLPIVNDPNSSIEESAKAYEKIINSGR